MSSSIRTNTASFAARLDVVMKKALLILNFVLTLVALLLISEYVNEFELAVGCAEKHGGAADKGGGHLHLRQQDRENDDVERNAENVVDGRALAFGDDLRLERAHGREVHPDASLEDEEAKHDERVARGDNRDEKGKAGYDERVLGDLLNGHGFHYDSKERAPCHAAYHESGEDEAEGESLAFGSRRLECWGPHEHKGVHAALKEGRDSPAEQDGGVGNDGVEALLENLDSFSRGGVGRCLAVVLTPVGLDVSPPDEEDKNGNVKGLRVCASPRCRCWDEKPALRPPFSEVLQILSDEHVRAFNMSAEDLSSSDANIVGGGGCQCLLS